ncbi:MAG: nucleotidyltransferase domain-containing protein [Methanothrix sp.]|nr:nucleotidyltransferase domain-containing protein [Methanothrix sp.]
MNLRIRDFFQTRQGWIFAVSDYCHPHGIRSLLRYVPDLKGEREAGGRRYRKLDFDDAYRFLRIKQPDWVADLHQVPAEEIELTFSPSHALLALAQTDPRVKRIVQTLAGAGVPMQQMGITGSMLVGLQAPGSDIDFVVYGPSWWKARDILARAKSNGEMDDLDEATWRKIYLKRKPEIGFEEFMIHEKRKGNRGMVEGTYFDLLFTRDWEQIQTQPRGRQAGAAQIEARVVNADFSFDSPAIYRLDHPEVKEIFSYSHTYAGQALPGERIEAKGVLEETENGLRLVVGTTREARGEWIRSLTLMES